MSCTLYSKYVSPSLPAHPVLSERVLCVPAPTGHARQVKGVVARYC